MNNLSKKPGSPKDVIKQSNRTQLVLLSSRGYYKIVNRKTIIKRTQQDGSVILLSN